MLILTGLVVPGVAQPAFQVHTLPEGDQRDPALAVHSDGRYAVAWTSTAPESGAQYVLARLYDAEDEAVTAPFLVHDPSPRSRYQPAVAMQPDGGVVVAWTSHSDSSMLDVYARVFDAAGRPRGPAFLVPETTALSQAAPDVAVDAAGRILVVWHSWGQDGGDRGVYLRAFDADGHALGGEQPVNTTTAYSQAYPALDVTPDGRSVVVWSCWKQDAPEAWSYDVYARRFDADLQPLGDEMQVNTYTPDNQWHAALAVDDRGRFVVSWTSWGQDGDEGGVYARLFGADGLPLSTEIPVNDTSESYQWLPSVALNEGLGFLVTWSSMGQDGDREGVYYRLFSETGEAVTTEHGVNGFTAGYQWEPVVEWQRDEIRVAWSSWGQDGDAYGVFLRAFPTMAVGTTAAPGMPGPLVAASPYPNPADGRVTFRYSVGQAPHVRLDVYDLLGRRVATLVNRPHAAGTYEVTWDALDAQGSRVSPGLYLYEIRSGSNRQGGTVVIGR